MNDRRSIGPKARALTAGLVFLLASAVCSKDKDAIERKSAAVSGGAANSGSPAAEVAATPQERPAASSSVPSPPLPSIADLVAAVKSAVVNVEVKSRVQAPGFALNPGSTDDLFDFFFGGRRGRRPIPMPREQIRQGLGSGFIIDGKGLVLTNNHVVQGAIDIRLHLDDGRAFDAEVMGRDPLTDLALVRIKEKAENLPISKLGDSDAMRVGDWVVAIGNPFGLASSVSAGIISARARDIRAGPYDDFLQTDAAINPGNSGGPLFNMRGEVIGINTAIVGSATGIGFAVPSNMAKALLPQLEKGKISRGWLGIGIQDLTPELAKALNVPVSKGALVTDVNEGTPAQKAGLRPDDVVVAVDGKPMDSGRALSRAIGFKEPGTTVTLSLYREGKKQDAKVVLGTFPERGEEGQAPESDEPRSGKLGLKLDDVDPRMMPGVGRGALIVDVVPGSPADHADLHPGMVVVEAAGKPISNARDLLRVLQSARSGSSVLLRIQLEGGRITRALPIP